MRKPYAQLTEDERAAERARQNNRYATDPKRRREIRNSNLLRKFGVTLEQFDALLTSQGNVCASCGDDQPTSKKSWHLDHCHTTGKVRGVLCHHCNLMLGYAKDAPDRLLKGAKYLARTT